MKYQATKEQSLTMTTEFL